MSQNNTTSNSSSSISNFRLLVKCDEPVKEVVIRVPSNVTFSELREAVAKGLDMKPDVVSRYTYLSVSFGRDVVELGKKGDTENCGEIGLRNDSALFIRAPIDIKPPKSRPRKKKKSEKDEKGVVSKDRYKGITLKNIYKKLEEAKEGKKKRVMEYIEIYASDFLANRAQFTKLNKSQMLEIIKSDRLNVKEVEVFEAVLAWGKAELKNQNLEDTPQNVKKVLSDILIHVRFPCMNTQDVAVTVVPSSLLESSQILDLFTYLGMKGGEKKPKLAKSLEMFNPKERKGRKPPSWFKFSANMKHAQLILSQDGTQITSTTTSYYQPIFGDIELNEGIHEWEVELVQFYQNAYSVIIGVVPTSFVNYTISQMLGYSGHIPAWAFACGHGQKYMNGSQTAYARTCQQGDVVRVRLDMDKKTIEFFINGTTQGIAYTGINGPVRPAISLYGSNTVVLKFPK